jgi:hypothetical protein
MPNNSKSKSKSRPNSRKSTQEKPTVVLDDDGFASILVKTKQPSSRKTTPTSTDTPGPLDTKRPEFLEPLSPKPILSPNPWDVLGMAEPEYDAMQQRVSKMYKEMDKKAYQDALLEELSDPGYWKGRIELLEREREFFNKKRGWSAADIACVDSIDAQIHECEDELERIYAEADRLEDMYD